MGDFFDISGKVVLITGGYRGIGEVTFVVYLYGIREITSLLHMFSLMQA